MVYSYVNTILKKKLIKLVFKDQILNPFKLIIKKEMKKKGKDKKAKYLFKCKKDYLIKDRLIKQYSQDKRDKM